MPWQGAATARIAQLFQGSGNVARARKGESGDADRVWASYNGRSRRLHLIVDRASFGFADLLCSGHAPFMLVTFLRWSLAVKFFRARPADKK